MLYKLFEDENEPVSWCYGHEFESKKRTEKTKEDSDNHITMGVPLPPRFDERGRFQYHTVYSSADLDVLPVEENGMKKFLEFFNKNYIVPKTEESFKGRCFIIFVIEKDGSLSNFNVVKNTPKEIEEEAIRVLKTAPNWISGKLKKQVVRSTYILPIKIK